MVRSTGSASTKVHHLPDETSAARTQPFDLQSVSSMIDAPRAFQPPEGRCSGWYSVKPGTPEYARGGGGGGGEKGQDSLFPYA